MDMGKGGEVSLLGGRIDGEFNYMPSALSPISKQNFSRHIIHERLLWSGKGGG
jgi:hypothetical protein